MIELCKNRASCSGCGACAAICPHHAISMECGKNGFLYPKVDGEKCVECGLCQKACDFKQFQKTGKKPASFAVRHIDAGEVATSRSGGVFMAMCREIIDRGGVVFGCVLNEKLEAVHQRAETYEACIAFKGSKYVQSDTKSTFAECDAALREGRPVLYSGTGCQVHGLLRFLEVRKTPTAQLYTVDIVCHGVPSPGVWQDYLAVYEEKTGKKIKHADFRDKSIEGWAPHIESYTTESGEKLIARNWTEVFYRHVMFRESCYQCVYTTTERRTDLTIADYWGVAKNAPEFNDNKGVSHVLVHSEKGSALFDAISPLIQKKETNLQTSMQPQLQKPIWQGWDHGSFWRHYEKNPKKTVKRWFFPGGGTRFVRAVEKKGKKFVRSVIKKIKK